MGTYIQTEGRKGPREGRRQHDSQKAGDAPHQGSGTAAHPGLSEAVRRERAKAHKAGAGRVELNSDLFHGGLTPTVGELIVAKRETGMKIMTMVRPREGGFCYTDAELEAIEAGRGKWKELQEVVGGAMDRIRDELEQGQGNVSLLLLKQPCYGGYTDKPESRPAGPVRVIFGGEKGGEYGG